jgi:hypothetical protein
VVVAGGAFTMVGCWPTELLPAEIATNSVSEKRISAFFFNLDSP